MPQSFFPCPTYDEVGRCRCRGQHFRYRYLLFVYILGRLVPIIERVSNNPKNVFIECHTKMIPTYNITLETY